MKKLFFVIIMSGVLAVSCKTPDTAVAGSTSETLPAVKTTANAEISDIASAHYNLFSDFNTLKINAKVNYQDNNSSYAPNVEIQMEKGKRILLSSTILFFNVKVYFTPERVSYYDTFNGTHYDGSYEFVSDFLGTEVTYENVENLLLGKAFYNLNEYGYTKEENNELALKLNDFFIKLMLGRQNEIASTEVRQEKNADKLVVNYPAYQTAENLFLPKEINIHAMQKNDVRIKIDYRRINVNPSLDFRYKIPNNSKEIKI